MGDLMVIDPPRRFIYPLTPPELPSPSTSETSRCSPTREAFGQPGSFARASMAHYAQAQSSQPGTAIEQSSQTGHQSRTAAKPGVPRQQLPSLTSLFGPPSARPLHSPLSERPPSHSSGSPLERSGYASGDRANASYFPPAHSPGISQPRGAYDLKYEAERQPRPAITRSYSGSGSPGYGDNNRAQHESRLSSDSSSKWSFQHDIRASEYTLGTQETFRSTHDQHFRLQFPSTKESRYHYHDQRHGQNGTSSPSTLTSTVGSEGLPSKDGLGPKIWTGTHFLPRFVRAAEVPGEGMCYFYDDGSHCKTVIDGEAVNAHWGVTKAGKPRKRLAIACITCREKKIKCDPDYPRCVQCEKFGRVCKFKNAPRGGHNTSPSTPPAELDEFRKAGMPSRPTESRISDSKSNSPISPRDTFRQVSPESLSQKRLKLDSHAYSPNGESVRREPAVLDHSKPRSFNNLRSESARIPDEVLMRASRTDPYISDPASIMATISHFFTHIEGTMILRFIPEEAFKSWVVGSANRKSVDDLMLIYSVLAIGVALSMGPKHIADEYAQVARFAQKNPTSTSLQLAQTRVLLAVYYASISRISDCNEMMSAAAGTAAALQLNLEFDQSREASFSAYPFDMNKAAYCEARRRTLWSLFLLERLNDLSPDRLTLVDAENVYVRLVGDTHNFEKQVESHMPVFDPYESNLPKSPEQAMEIRDYLVEIVHLWSNCQTAIYRSARRPQSSEAEAAKMQGLIKKVQDWHAALPGYMSFSESRLESAALAGNASPFVIMHLVYNLTMVRLNRYQQRAGQMTVQAKSAYFQKCCNYASNIIEIAQSMDRLMRFRTTSLRVPPPVMAMGVTEAVDVLTAYGPFARLTDKMDKIRAIQPVIDNMSHLWERSYGQGEAISRRLQGLARIRDRGLHSPYSGEGYSIVRGWSEERDEEDHMWQLSDPIEKVYPKDMDIVYSQGIIERRTYLPC